MTDEEKDMELEDLFRKQLEGSEIVPGDDLTKHFMNRLGRKEFMRFNAARFNIVYLATALAAAATVTGLLLPSPDNGKIDEPAGSDSIPAFEIAAPSEIKTSATDIINSNRSEISTDKENAGVIRENPVHGSRSNEKIEAEGKNHSRIGVSKPKENSLNMPKQTLPAAVAEASVTSGCVPLHVNFKSIASGNYSVEWSFGDGGYSDDNEVSYIYDLPGLYNVTLTVTSENGQKAVTTLKIDVWMRPEAWFEIPDSDISFTEDDVAFNNLSAGATRYQWSFGDGSGSEEFEPSHRYAKFGKYDVTLIAVSENGCADTISIRDAFTDTGMYLRFPNAFTPNTGGPTGGYYSQRSDLNNEVFHPVYSGVVRYDLKIYSKQGLLIFETNDVMNGWDGYYKGQLCSPGVYVWKVRGTYRNGEQVVMSGDVTLLKY